MKNIFTQTDHEILSQAIRAAEAGTSGEIYVVVSRSADDYWPLSLLFCALAALFLSWPLLYFTPLPASQIFLVQAGLFTFLSAACLYKPFRFLLVPAAVKAEAVHSQATTLFLAHGIHLTSARTGILIYVALFERRAEVLADSGIHQKVGNQAWDELTAQIVLYARQGRLRGGLEKTIADAGALLAQHFPRLGGDCNELPDRVVEI